MREEVLYLYLFHSCLNLMVVLKQKSDSFFVKDQNSECRKTCTAKNNAYLMERFMLIAHAVIVGKV